MKQLLKCKGSFWVHKARQFYLTQSEYSMQPDTQQAEVLSATLRDITSTDLLEDERIITLLLQVTFNNILIKQNSAWNFHHWLILKVPGQLQPKFSKMEE